MIFEEQDEQQILGPDGTYDALIKARRMIADLRTELHAIKYEVMGGEDAPGSANLVTVDDVREQMRWLRASKR